VLGAVQGAWRDDLPLVLPDGAILTATGADVALVDGETLRARRTVPGGAGDFWHLVLWNGFRPRAAGLDQPVTFREAATPEDDAGDTLGSDDAESPGDSAAADTLVAPSAPAESTTAPRPAVLRPTVPPPTASAALISESAAGQVIPVAYAGPRPTPALLGQPEAAAMPTRDAPARRRSGRRTYTVQFAAAPSEREARRTMARLRVPGATLRVVPRAFDGQTVYRVVAGPFATRGEAERAGRAAGAGNYWVYVGAP
jgi:cell division septation protein DedD